MMKILFVVPYTPNLIRTRPHNLIRELSNRGNSVTVATLWTDEQEKTELAELSQTVHQVEKARLTRWQSYWNCFISLPTKKPLQAVYCREPALEQRLESLVTNGGNYPPFDVIHVEHLRGIPFALKVKRTNPKIPIVWDSVDCISLLFRKAASLSTRRINRWITSFELSRTERYESWLVDQFDHTLVTSMVDKQAFLDLIADSNNDGKISVIPNGVDLEYFSSGEAVSRDENTIVISGKMSYHANITMVTNFVESIWPKIQNKRPGVKLWIVGKDPTSEILSFGELPGVSVTGYVKDIRPFLKSATVAVAPVKYGVGIQNKVLESMACGTPIVTTPQAVSALQIVPGRDLIVSELDDQFADEVVRLLRSKNLQEQIGQAGLSYVKSFHNWSAITEKLEGIYHEVIHKAGQLSF